MAECRGCGVSFDEDGLIDHPHDEGGCLLSKLEGFRKWAETERALASSDPHMIEEISPAYIVAKIEELLK